MGFASADAFRAAVIEGWRAAIVAMQEPDDRDRAVLRLHETSLASLASPWPMQALALGWSALDLWGVHDGPAWRARLDVWGLLPLIGLGSYPRRIAAVDASCARLVTRTGAPQTFRRCNSSENCVPWFEHPELTGGQP
jgi:hypothetical protein